MPRQAKIAASLVALSALVVVLAWYWMRSIDTGLVAPSVKPSPVASLSQKAQCTDSCCEKGYKNAEQYGNNFYQAGDPEGGEWYGCPRGYAPNQLRCITSPTWCQQAETLGIQGVAGRAWITEGNCMPGPKIDPSCREVFGERRIVVREALDPAEDIDPTDRMRANKTLKFIASATSSPDGYFSIFLEPGEYSLFVERDGVEYCAEWRCNFGVVTGSTTRVDAHIDRAAW